MKYYHITNIENLPSISTNGLEPFPNIINSDIPGDVVYLTTTDDPDILNIQATVLGLNKYAVLEIKNLDSGNVIRNPGNDFTNLHECIHMGRIDPHKMRFNRISVRSTTNLKKTLERLKNEIIQTGVVSVYNEQIVSGIDNILPFINRTPKQRVRHVVKNFTYKDMLSSTLAMDLFSLDMMSGMLSYCIENDNLLSKNLINVFGFQNREGLLFMYGFFIKKKTNRYLHQKTGDATKYMEWYNQTSEALQPFLDDVLKAS